MWQEGGEFVLLLLAVGAVALGSLVRGSQAETGWPAALVDPALFASRRSSGYHEQMLQQVALGGAMIALPIYLQMVLEYNAMEAGLSLAPLSLSMFAVALVAGRRPASAARRHHPQRLPPARRRAAVILPSCRGGLRLVSGGPARHRRVRLGLLVSQLNNYTLAPISEERISEAAGMNSAAGSFGLSFGLALAGAIMLATLVDGFTSMTDESSVLRRRAGAGRGGPRARRGGDEQPALEARLAGQPAEIQDEIIRINTEARPLPSRSPCSSRSSPRCSAAELVPDGPASCAEVDRRSEGTVLG